MAGITRRDQSQFPSIDRVFGRFFEDPFFRTAMPAFMTTAEEGTLPVDVSENENTVIVRASLPGFEKKDVQIEVHDNVLTIKAEHSEEKVEENERYYRRERQYGSVSRRVALPSAVVEDQAKAELKEGVLTLRLPKTREASPRKIDIS